MLSPWKHGVSPQKGVLLSWLLQALITRLGHAGTPAPPEFYRHQLVDHSNSSEYAGQEWSQRYYTWDQDFDGPGSPILVILGGEGEIAPETGLLYPFVTHHLAKAWGAFVLEPEHRFYGVSQPLPKELLHDNKNGMDPRVTLLTSEQALRDAMRLIHHIQEELSCSRDKFSKTYCPIITVGGSYPGFLSAMARVRFPHVVDMAYAASAPMKFYSQQVSADAYYNHISIVAEKSKPGCANAVRATLDALAVQFATMTDRSKIDDMATLLGFCPGTVPDYIQDGSMFRDEVFMIVGYTFANDNMANYPPDERTRLYHSCETFLSTTAGPVERAKEFFISHLSDDNGCVDMSWQLPTGPNATISSGDWSGVGTGTSGESWDFQTCTLLVEAIGFSNQSMFPPRDWSMEWLEQHCQSRFGVTPEPYKLVDEWHIDDLLMANATRILFTNGLNDGWSVGGLQTNLSESLLVLNFENGAHHSDLSGRGPSEDDTDDIRQGFIVIQHIFSQWLDDVRAIPWPSSS